MQNLELIAEKNLASGDSSRPLTEILHESIDFQNCSEPYILGSVWSNLFIDILHLILCLTLYFA